MIKANPRNREVLKPFLNGDDLNSSPTALASRWAINFRDWSEDRAAQYPEPFSVVSRLVKPERQRKKSDGSYVLRKPLPERWWHYADKRPGLYAAIQDMETVLAVALTSRSLMPMRVPSDQVLSHALVVIATESFSDQAVLSSSVHQAWAMKYGSAMRNDFRYTPSSVFVTFPRPVSTCDLAAIGQELDRERREVMLRRQLGLTKLYSLVNDRGVVDDLDIRRLRGIHSALDEAVVAAYGWADVSLGHGFHAYRQMERYTISPQARVELLARLLAENHRRTELQGGDIVDLASDDSHPLTMEEA